MKHLYSILKSKRFFYLFPFLFYMGCLDSGSDSSSDTSNSSGTSIEQERAAIETECRTIGYEAVYSLVIDVLQVPDTAALHGGISLSNFLTTNEGALGGQGVSESRECSPLYFRTVSHLGSLVCQWIAKNQPEVLYPEGIENLQTLVSHLYGSNPDAEEIEYLTELKSLINNLDANFDTLDQKRMAALCTAAFSSLAVQTL